jgi:hypothetical protein
VINAGVLMSGQLTVETTDGKVLHLKAGDPIVEVVNTLHYGINEGTVPAEIVVFYAGTVGTGRHCLKTRMRRLLSHLETAGRLNRILVRLTDKGFLLKPAEPSIRKEMLSGLRSIRAEPRSQHGQSCII